MPSDDKRSGSPGKSFRRLLRHPHASGEVDRLLRLGLIRERSPPHQSAIRHQPVALGIEQSLDKHRSRLVAVELERRQEIHFLDGLDMPAGMHAERGFRKRLDPHDTRQHRRAVNAVVVQERLRRRIKRGLHRQTTIEGHAGDLADHRSLRGNALPERSRQRLRVQSAGLVPFVQHDARGAARRPVRPAFRR